MLSKPPVFQPSLLLDFELVPLSLVSQAFCWGSDDENRTKGRFSEDATNFPTCLMPHSLSDGWACEGKTPRHTWHYLALCHLQRLNGESSPHVVWANAQFSGWLCRRLGLGAKAPGFALLGGDKVAVVNWKMLSDGFPAFRWCPFQVLKNVIWPWLYNLCRGPLNSLLCCFGMLLVDLQGLLDCGPKSHMAWLSFWWWTVFSHDSYAKKSFSVEALQTFSW